MQIKFVEIQNFRKLKSIRVDFSPKTTLFVGANNSGKTSAMVALRLFLIHQARFGVNDFTISHWGKINKIGTDWEAADHVPDFEQMLKNFEPILPALDVWIEARADEIHYISHILPNLQWSDEPVGVRLRFEPRNLEDLYKDYTSARQTSRNTIDAANATKEAGTDPYTLPLWPANLHDFLSHRNRLHTHFAIKGYILDPTKLTEPSGGNANPQGLLEGLEPLNTNPFEGLIQIDDIDAQRGFADLSGSAPGDGRDGEFARDSMATRRLSEQMRKYYTKHIDPSELPDPSDIEALEGIMLAQHRFNKKLEEGFEAAFKELEGMGYPGLADPKLTISTKVEPLDGLRHASAVQYSVIDANKEESRPAARLPEQSSGLGYQNLISIIFRLISFRDSWMEVGKAGKRSEMRIGETKSPAPLHLVLIEEPEAHLHAQVQQIFIRKAYDVLRKHEKLNNDRTFVTQLVVSTHSSHIVHEGSFAALRYFRRLPALGGAEAPVSVVVNLSGVFGSEDATDKFETRYIRTTHCDLFFADAVILVEGAGERMLLPHFIRARFSDSSQSLYHRYISILEIGGSHAHRLKPLIDALALPTLVITDLDSGSKSAGDETLRKERPVRSKAMVTMNDTLSKWVPMKGDLDSLLALTESEKIVSIDKFSSVRAAYQTPVEVMFTPKDAEPPKTAPAPEEALSYTFEDSLALENLDLFRTLDGTGLIARFRKSIETASSLENLLERFYGNLSGAEKGKFALDMIFEVEPGKIKVPTYIHNGLVWLESELKKKDEKVLVTEIFGQPSKGVTEEKHA